jgi:outer membrane lipoprotein-sorting protein
MASSSVRVSAWLLPALLAGCAHVPPVQRPYAEPSAAELYASLQERAHKMHGIDAVAKVDERAKGIPRVTVKVQIFALRPDRLRLELQGPLGSGAATLVTDGDRFSLLDGRSNRFFTGPASPCNVARLIQVELPPSDIVDVLLGSVPISGSPISVEWDASHGGREILRIANPDGMQTRVWLDHRDRVWDPVHAERRDAKGTLWWSVDHSEFTAQEGGMRLPARTQVEDPRHKATATLRYREQSPNPQLTEGGFMLDPPAGLTAEPVDCR